MTMKDPRKKAITLCLVFGAVYMLHGVGAIFLIFPAIAAGNAIPDSLILRYFLLCLVVAAVCYLPLSIWIHRLAKRAQMPVLKILSLVAAIGLSAFVVICAVVIPLALFLMK